MNDSDSTKNWEYGPGAPAEQEQCTDQGPPKANWTSFSLCDIELDLHVN